MKKILFLLTLVISIGANALMLNLKNVDIKTLINTVAMANDKNFMVDPRVKGRVNIISNKDIDGDQLYQIFLTILKAHGYVVLEGENLSRIVPKSLTKSESAFVSNNATDAIITKILDLKSVEAAKIVPIVRPLMSAHGLLSVYTPNNSLIIIDTGANIARLESIVASLDKPMDDDFEFIKMKNSSASQMASILKPLFADQGKLINITVDKHNNQLIVSGNKDRRLKVRLLVAELDKQQTDAGTTAIIYLKYANAKDILPILQGINQYNTNAIKDTKGANVVQSNIQANEATNSIIVTGDSETKQMVKNIIAKLDVRRAQVLIEAIIAEVNVSDAKELGIQWISKGGSGVGLINLNGAIPALLASSNGSGASLANGFAGGVNYVAGSYDENTKTGFGILLNALNSKGNTNILSTPSILTLDNHEAEIVVGQEVPFITNTQMGSNNANPFQNYERKDVGLKLKVKPQINNGSSIKLDIAQEISNVLNSSSAADLITSKRTLNTSVMVEDGKLLVLGGLIDDNVRDNKTKVPLLGDIPVVGDLFSYNTKSKGKSNLMIFIRPTILKDQIASDTVSMEKYNYIRAQQLLYPNDNGDNNDIKQRHTFSTTNTSNHIAPNTSMNVSSQKLSEKNTQKAEVEGNTLYAPQVNDTTVINNQQKEIVAEIPKIVQQQSNNIVQPSQIANNSEKKVQPVQLNRIQPIQVIEENVQYLDGYLEKKLDSNTYSPINNSPYYIK